MTEKPTTYAIGQAKEQVALQYLLQQGLRFIEKNYRARTGEIDLIMEDRDDIVFVEVRFRKKNDHSHPLESITAQKIQRLIKTATIFMQAKAWLNQRTGRFDVIAIQDETIEWVKNAFMTG